MGRSIREAAWPNWRTCALDVTRTAAENPSPMATHTCGCTAGKLCVTRIARSRWNGDRLCGRAPADRTRGGHQDPPRGVLGRSQGAPALHEGGEVGGGARPPERDRRPRGGPAGGPLLHGDGARRGGEHGRRPRSTGRVGPDRSHPHRRGRMPGAVGRARCRARPPRRQAGQHPPDRRPHGQAGRLRAGSMHGPERRERDPGRSGRGDPFLHEPRAVPVGAGRCPRRHLCAGRDLLCCC